MAGHTIFALSSGSGMAGVAIIRMSGPAVRFGLETLAGGVPAPRRAALVAVRRPGSGELLDRGIAIFFPGPASFTGEDCGELHVHGGRAVVAGVVDALGGLEGFRLAEPGEFTRRAFENGKLDLTAAEGLRDLVAAETEAQRRLALRQAGGELAALYEGWRDRLVTARAFLEAALDFSDEGDVPLTVDSAAEISLRAVAMEIEDHLADGRRGEAIRDGIEVVLVGAPNVGKSSLINGLARRDVAIVTAEAGTTRDLIEVRLDLGGFPVTIVDTAGLREAEGVVEAEGIRRTVDRARRADLVLAVSDGFAPPDVEAFDGVAVWPVRNKVDLIASESMGPAVDADAISVSALTGAGIDGLLGRLTDWASERFGGSDGVVITRARHREALMACLMGLKEAATPGKSVELRAEDVRRAADHLGRVTGRIDVEDVLGRIFAEFCIGK